jgi:uncharacterized membrane protein YfhO
MTLYSIIQYLSASYLYYKLTTLTDNQYLYVDIPCLILSFLMNFGKSLDSLTKDQPIMFLLSFQVLGSVFLNIFIVVIFQILALVILTQQSFFVEAKDLYKDSLEALEDDEKATYENNVRKIEKILKKL